MSEQDLDVSRETFDKLRQFAELVQKWTSKINLISRGTSSEIWERHVLDSVQLHALAPTSGHWVDLGSGGGFPGIVAAIMSKGAALDHRFTLVESDQRKAVFLRTAIRELGLNVTVQACRIESLAPQEADILSARALTDLDGLLAFVERHLSKNGVALFPKGAQWQKEDAAARLRWSYQSEAITSQTNAQAAILKIKEVERV